MPVRDAIVLAAGVGMRLRSVDDDRPKGLVEIGGETLIGRSIRLLRAAGIERITIVAGYRAESYLEFASGLATSASRSTRHSRRPEAWRHSMWGSASIHATS